MDAMYPYIHIGKIHIGKILFGRINLDYIYLDETNLWIDNYNCINLPYGIFNQYGTINCDIIIL